MLRGWDLHTEQQLMLCRAVAVLCTQSGMPLCSGLTPAHGPAAPVGVTARGAEGLGPAPRHTTASFIGSDAGS